MSAVKYVAIGDSFSEGVGDELPDGRVRGWADLVAQGWADATAQPIQYANFAIRGRLAWPVVEQQLEPALALGPTHLSFNAGGNDMLRPRADIEHIADAFSRVLRRCAESGVTLIVLSGANPSAQLPMSDLIQRRGDQLSAAVERRIANQVNVVTAWNWPDNELSARHYWDDDRLHMNTDGHHRVAARVLDAVGVAADDSWWMPAAPRAIESVTSLQYYRQHVGPWVSRRLRKRSSGDNRLPKHPTWVEISPQKTPKEK